MALRNVSGNISVLGKLDDKRMGAPCGGMGVGDTVIEMGFLISVGFGVWEPTL